MTNSDKLLCPFCSVIKASKTTNLTLVNGMVVTMQGEDYEIFHQPDCAIKKYAS